MSLGDEKHATEGSTFIAMTSGRTHAGRHRSLRKV